MYCGLDTVRHNETCSDAVILQPDDGRVVMRHDVIVEFKGLRLHGMVNVWADLMTSASAYALRGYPQSARTNFPPQGTSQPR